MGRQAMAGDINPVAYCVTAAKTQAPVFGTIQRRVRELSKNYEPTRWAPRARCQPGFFKAAYTERTLAQLLYLRSELNWKNRRADAMVAALVMGSLHGETERSPSYLSAQMPRTISTKPAYSMKYWSARGLLPPERDVFELLLQRARYRYVSEPPQGASEVMLTDFRELPRMRRTVSRRSVACIVTSPPYLDVTDFGEDQWLRLWFLGGPPYPTRRRISSDDRHECPTSYWRMIADFWRMAGHMVRPGGHVVVRLAGKGLAAEDLVQGLVGCAEFSPAAVSLIEWEQSEIVRRQTDAFRPGSRGVRFEIDAIFRVS